MTEDRNTDQEEPPGRRSVLVSVLVGVLLLGLVATVVAAAWLTATTSPFERALPPEAEGVEKLFVDMTPDFAYFMRAEMSEPAYTDYTNKLRITSEEPVHTPWAPLHPMAPEWWRPGAEVGNTRVLVDGSESSRTVVQAKWEGGVMWLYAWSE